MAGQTIIIGNWNDTTPAAPAGHDNVKFQKDASSPPNISAYVPRADVAGTKYGTILYDGSGNANRYLGGDGAWHDLPAGSIPNGGTTGQVLAKASGDDGDVEWADASGGGGDYYGNGILKYTPPVAGEFSWINQGAATISGGAGDPMILTGPASGSDNHRILEQALPSTPYTIDFTLRGYWASSNYAWYGLIIRDSGSGKLISFCHSYQVEYMLGYNKWNSITNYNSSAIISRDSFYAFWDYRLVDDGTNFTLYGSPEGVIWIPLYQVSRTDFLAAPDRIGVYVNSRNSSPVYLGLLSWKKS